MIDALQENAPDTSTSPRVPSKYDTKEHTASSFSSSTSPNVTRRGLLIDLDHANKLGTVDHERSRSDRTVSHSALSK